MPVMYGTVGAPSSPSLGEQTSNAALQGKQGDLVVSELHSRGWTAAYRGRMFIASTAAAGVTIPVSSTTSPTFLLWNPPGSGVVAEILKINIGITNATTVVSPFLLGYASGVAVAPTLTTRVTINPALIGGAGSPQVQLWTSATITATTTFLTIGSVSATSGAFANFNEDLQGAVGLTPGSLAHVCGTAAQSSASAISVIYAEWPL
jgi:hypothetical protein